MTTMETDALTWVGPQDVLYLMIVNMPSEAEMAAATATAEGRTS